jgi:hypothetical protein
LMHQAVCLTPDLFQVRHRVVLPTDPYPPPLMTRRVETVLWC